MVICSKCGSDNAADAEFCSKCGKKLNSNGTNWEAKFVVLVLILVVGTIAIAAFIYFDTGEVQTEIPTSASSSDSSIPDQSEFYLPTVSGENILKYKDSCKEVNLNKPLNELEQLKGHKVKVQGELVDVMQNSEGSTNIQVKIPNVSLYPYIIVTYSSKIPYSLGDKLEIYGEYGGSAQYENDEVPFIEAAYIEKI